MCSLALLRVVAVLAQLVDAQIRMRAIRQADRRTGARDFLHRHDMREITEIAAAVFLLDGQAEDAELAELRPERVRKRVVAVGLRGQRCDLAAGECLHGIAQLVDVVAEIEIQGRAVHGSGSGENEWRNAAKRGETAVGSRAVSAATRQSMHNSTKSELQFIKLTGVHK
jgi:hypothetical protein